MKKVILIRYGEISLKGLNRRYFEDILKKNIARRLRPFSDARIKKVQSRMEIHLTDSDECDVIAAIKDVFGIAYISKAYVVESEMGKIEQAALALYKDGKTFKVETRRGDKCFHLTSPEISRQVGGYILKNTQNAKVDVHHPEILIEVEVRKETYVYATSIKGRAGLPTGTGGTSALLLSGGIDSPVAGYMMASRGVELVSIYFHSSPYTAEEAKEKVIELAKILACYAPQMKLFVVPFTEIQESIIESCDIEYLTILMRRMMMRIAQDIACREGALSLITGESLGQVASQTMQSIQATNAVADLPVFRPLIGLDKIMTINMAKEIGTYEVSIRPYEDCCTIFTPKHPQTKPTIKSVLYEEEKLGDYQVLCRKAAEEAERYQF